MTNANENGEATLQMPQVPVSSAKEAVDVFKPINRSRLMTAPQMALSLKLLGYVSEEFEPGILQGYLEAIDHPTELRNGKVWFVF